jgi:hypothetical protein
VPKESILRPVSLLIASLLLPAAATERLPDLTGWANDANGNLTWSSTGARESATTPWLIQHSVTNRAAAGQLRVTWEPDIYDGWIPHGETRGSGGTDGLQRPQQQDGTIHYGKEGVKTAPSYRPGPPQKTYPPLVTDIAVTVKWNGTFKDIVVEARAEAEPRQRGAFSVIYTVRLKTMELVKDLRAEWSSAESAELNAQLRHAHDETLIRFDHETGVARYEVSIPIPPVVRTGAMVFKDPGRNRLGYAYAPAYGPPVAKSP